MGGGGGEEERTRVNHAIDFPVTAVRRVITQGSISESCRIGSTIGSRRNSKLAHSCHSGREIRSAGICQERAIGRTDFFFFFAVVKHYITTGRCNMFHYLIVHSRSGIRQYS